MKLTEDELKYANLVNMSLYDYRKLHPDLSHDELMTEMDKEVDEIGRKCREEAVLLILLDDKFSEREFDYFTAPD